MKHFWALPVFLRLAVARQHHFNVFDDLLAHPQYAVAIADNAISEDLAEARLRAASRGVAVTKMEPLPTPEAGFDKASHRGQSSGLGEDLSIPEDVAGYQYMVKQGQRYLCSIPRIPPEEPEPASNQTKAEEEKDLVRATEQGWQLLKGMEGTCIYFISGWWSYSFCFNDGVRQFHQLPPGRNVPAYPPVEDKNVASYILGRFDKPERKRLDDKRAQKETTETAVAMPKLKTKGDLRYLVQDLRGGTECDLTGKERRIEVQFHCEASASDRISMIKETATCQYLMVISTPRLCNEVAFLPPKQEVPHQIACTRILPAASIPSFLAEQNDEVVEAEKAELKADKLLDKGLNGLLDDPAVLTEEDIMGSLPALGMKDWLKVGDIVVGGHKVVPPGKTIEKSAILGGGQETFVATIAKSDGFIASDEELERLNIHNARQEIEGVTVKLQKLAAGKPWRLDIVDTPRGRQLRGIVDSDDDAVGNDADDSKGYVDIPEELPEGTFDLGEEKRESLQTAEDDGDKEEEGSEETYKDEL